VENFDEEPQKVLDYLVKVAKEDGIISDDEKSFLKVVEAEIEKYKTYLGKTLEDSKITLSEKIYLVKSRKEIIQRAIDVVREDDKVTEEEQNLLDTLEIKLQDLDKYEKKFAGL
jgi:tellurite resistance protein